VVGTTTVTTRWDKCGGAPRGPVSAMLPRLKFLFSRGPPSARSPQIRPHPVTVSHLSSVSFFLQLPPSPHAAYSLIRKWKNGTFRSLPSTTITTPLYPKWRISGRCLFVFLRLLFTALPDRIGLPWSSLSRRSVSRTSPHQNSQELKSSRRGRGPSEGRVCMYKRTATSTCLGKHRIRMLTLRVLSIFYFLLYRRGRYVNFLFRFPVPA